MWSCLRDRDRFFFPRCFPSKRKPIQEVGLKRHWTEEGEKRVADKMEQMGKQGG